MSIILFLFVRNREYPGNFQNKSVSFFLSNEVYYHFSQTEVERRIIFEGSHKRGQIVKLFSWVIGCHKRWKGLSFREIWNTPSPPLFLVRHPYKKYCRTWSSMKYEYGYRTMDSCQKQRILLSTRQRSDDYLKLSKENAFGNMMLSYWPCFTWKLFMIWLHNLVKLIFQKQIIMS